MGEGKAWVGGIAKYFKNSIALLDNNIENNNNDVINISLALSVCQVLS